MLLKQGYSVLFSYSYDTVSLYFHTLRSGFHCEAHIGINPYRTLDVVLTAMSCVTHDLVRKYVVHFSCDIGKLSTRPKNQVFA